MATPEDIEYEDVVVTGLEVWFKNGQKYQATLVPPDTHWSDGEYLTITVYPYDERCEPGKTVVVLAETVCSLTNQWVQRYPVDRPRKVVPPSPFDRNTGQNESDTPLDPALGPPASIL